MYTRSRLLALVAWLLMLPVTSLVAQEKSVKPGINKSFENPDVKSFIERFEREGREIWDQRHRVVEALDLHPGDSIADIGAGTGFMTMLFAEAVGPKGTVYANDIAKNFLTHIQEEAAEKGLKNVKTVLASADSSNLPPNSLDAAYICDTYHHFEYPQKTLKSIYAALKPGGKLYVIDFERIPGKTSEWIMNHVRAGKDVFRSEIEQAGFKFVEEKKGIFKDNYFLVFQKPKKDA